eukprot:TRINITY_DN412_c0_g1_i2.p2 TRINITY_DN412_c0_g1~~TRINITY_DN412_c0_g1_i2.p2  ORF type:complete len:289 (-),score=75.94 TRINITY_DN412_c0_g1_i2:591-1457(-)
MSCAVQLHTLLLRLDFVGKTGKRAAEPSALEHAFDHAPASELLQFLASNVDPARNALHADELGVFRQLVGQRLLAESGDELESRLARAWQLAGQRRTVSHPSPAASSASAGRRNTMLLSQLQSCPADPACVDSSSSRVAATAVARHRCRLLTAHTDDGVSSALARAALVGDELGELYSTASDLLADVASSGCRAASLVPADDDDDTRRTCHQSAAAAAAAAAAALSMQEARARAAAAVVVCPQRHACRRGALAASRAGSRAAAAAARVNVRRVRASSSILSRPTAAPA